MNRISATIIALALVVIALNMTYLNFETIPESPKNVEEKVLPVIGRVSLVFDGLGTTVGFLVKDGENFKIATYDEGSMAANEAFQPKYMAMVKFTDGKIAYQPIVVDTFH